MCVYVRAWVCVCVCVYVCVRVRACVCVCAGEEGAVDTAAEREREVIRQRLLDKRVCIFFFLSWTLCL